MPPIRASGRPSSSGAAGLGRRVSAAVGSVTFHDVVSTTASGASCRGWTTESVPPSGDGFRRSS
jgi:hypothetical protein